MIFELVVLATNACGDGETSEPLIVTMKQALVPETIKPNVSAGSAKASSQMLQWEVQILH